MTSRPTEYPRWATSPPASTITAPTALQQASGWQPAGSVEFPDGKPIRQIENWRANLNGEWEAFLDQVAQRTSDLHPNHALPGGTPPSLDGASLAILAGEFSARVYADGYGIGGGLGVLQVPGPAANYSYTASRDTYWDLSRNGVWTPVVVANGANEATFAPVTANSTRVYMVVSDATGRVSLVDRRRSRIRLNSFDALGNIRAALTATIDSPGSSVDGDRRTAKRTAMVDSTSGATYELVDEILGNNSIVPIRWYVRMTAAQLALIKVVGARLTSSSGTVAWIAESTIAYREVFNGVSEEFGQISGLTAGVSTFNDSAWTTITAGGAARLFRTMRHALRFLVDEASTGADANLDADVEHVRRASNYTLIDQELDSSNVPTGQRIYVTGQLFNTVGNVARVMARNCYYDEAAPGWARDAAGDAWIAVVGTFGFQVFRHPSAGTATWNDAIGASNWVQVFSVGGGIGKIETLLPVHAEAELESGTIVRRTGIVSDTISADHNDYNPAGIVNASVVRIDPGAATRNITGLLAAQGGTELMILNVGTNPLGVIYLSVENASSLAANRFAGPVGPDTDPRIAIGRGATLWYDSLSSRWRIVSDKL